jgi:hypothetical protein
MFRKHTHSAGAAEALVDRHVQYQQQTAFRPVTSPPGIALAAVDLTHLEAAQVAVVQRQQRLL